MNWPRPLPLPAGSAKQLPINSNRHFVNKEIVIASQYTIMVQAPHRQHLSILFQFFHFLLFSGRNKFLFFMPMLTDFMNIAPMTRQTGQIATPRAVVSMILGRMAVVFKYRPETASTHYSRPSSSIHPQFFQFDTGIPDHGIDHIHGLKSDSLQGSPGNMGGCRSTANTRNSSPDSPDSNRERPSLSNAKEVAK